MDELRMWNNVADRYQKIVRDHDSGYPDRLISFLRQRNALSPGSRIADIGCGTGKYALRFADLGCDLLITDIAHRMLNYAEYNLRDYPVKVDSILCDWSATPLQKYNWARSVDLAFAAMTPAIRTEEDIKKLCQMSRKYCFISKFLRKDDSLINQAAEILGVVPPEKCAEEKNPLSFVEMLTRWGYMPELKCVSYQWENIFSADQAAAIIHDSDLGPVLVREGKAHIVDSCLKQMSDTPGYITQKVHAVTVWIFWEV